MADPVENLPPTPPSKLPIFFILLVLIATYGVTLTFQFQTWDDFALIERNPMNLDPGIASLIKIWKEPFVEIYMPITYSLWMFLAWPARWVGLAQGYPAESPLSPTVYHGVTLLIFIGVVYRVYELIRRFGPSPWVAATASLLYGLHPLQAESVCWISENKGILGAFFGLWGLSLYIDSVRASDPKEASRLDTRATILYVLALLSKPSIVNLPIIAAVLDFGLLRRPPHKIAWSLLRWVLLAAVMVWITRLSQPTAAKAAIPWLDRPFIALFCAGFYLQKIFWPVGFHCDYSQNTATVLSYVSQPQIVGILGWVAIAVILLGLFYFRQRVLATVILLYLAILSPNLGFIPFAFQIMSTVADRYGAPSLLAFAFGAAFLMERFRPRTVSVAIGLALALVVGVLGFQQVLWWKDTESLTARQLQFDPPSGTFLNNRAVHRMRSHQYEAALEDARASLQAQPDRFPAQMNLALCAIELKKYEEAEEHARVAFERFPGRDEPPVVLVRLLQFLKRYGDAIPFAEEMRRRYPSNRSDRLRHARLLILSGKRAEGLKIFAEDQGREINGMTAEEITAQVFEQAGEHKQALDLFETLVQRYSLRAKLSMSRIAWIRATTFDDSLRDPAQAVKLARQALDAFAAGAISPPATAFDVLAAAEAAAGDYESARKHAADAIAAAIREQNPKMKADIEARLDLYKSGKPFRVEAPALSDLPSAAL